jgi:hypothetical protein
VTCSTNLSGNVKLKEEKYKLNENLVKEGACFKADNVEDLGVPAGKGGSGRTAFAIFALSCSIVLQVLARIKLKSLNSGRARCGLSAPIPHVPSCKKF